MVLVSFGEDWGVERQLRLWSGDGFQDIHRSLLFEAPCQAGPAPPLIESYWTKTKLCRRSVKFAVDFLSMFYWIFLRNGAFILIAAQIIYLASSCFLAQSTG
jgi:hypothetical protein